MHENRSIIIYKIKIDNIRLKIVKCYYNRKQSRFLFFLLKDLIFYTK